MQKFQGGPVCFIYKPIPLKNTCVRAVFYMKRLQEAEEQQLAISNKFQVPLSLVRMYPTACMHTYYTTTYMLETLGMHVSARNIHTSKSHLLEHAVPQSIHTPPQHAYIPLGPYVCSARVSAGRACFSRAPANVMFPTALYIHS